ncbi:ABC transporter permease [Acidimicrobiaceae bacterium AH-315-P05]|nr:ABC transporter permease [Acidimicrobiaceae bacterium AH-315-P05]
MTDSITPRPEFDSSDASDVALGTLIVEDLPDPTAKPTFADLVRSMPWTARLGALWLFVVVFLAVTADYLWFFKDPNYLYGVFEGEATNQGPSTKFWLGNDNLARDIFARLVYGARVSLIVAGVAVAFGTIIGGFLGSLVGFVRGKTETTIMALVDVILAFPGLVLLLVMVAITETRSLTAISLVIGMLSIAPYTRVARANALTVSNREFVQAARSIGTKPLRILVREIIPNVMPSIFAFAFVAAAAIMVLEGTLAFLGLSVQPPTATWGQMIFQARADMRQNLWPVVYPSAALVITVLALNTVGDWMRERNSARSAALG